MVVRVKLDFRLQLTFLLVTGLGLLEARVNVVVPEINQNFVKDFKLENYNGLDANINQIFDDVLPAIKNLIIKGGLDPLRLRDIQKDLPGILGMHGVLYLSNGWMQGLSAVQRSGDVMVSYENKVVTLDALVGIDTIDNAFDYNFKYWIVSRSGALRARLSDTKLRVILKANLEQYRISLESLQITSVSNIKVTVEGNAFDKILSAAINAFMGSFRQEIVATVENQGSQVIREYLNQINEKLPRPDGTRLTSFEDSEMFHNGNALDNSKMMDNIPTFVEFVVV